LRDTSLELLTPSSFAYEFYSEPSAPQLQSSLRRPRRGPGTDLRYDPIEIDVSRGDADEASDLAYAVSLAANK
jgi:hypothetical protein